MIKHRIVSKDYKDWKMPDGSVWRYIAYNNLLICLNDFGEDESFHKATRFDLYSLIRLVFKVKHIMGEEE
jgi:hypothetical protein